MKAKYVGNSSSCVTNGKVYEVEAYVEYYHLVDDEGDKNSYPRDEFDVVAEESEQPLLRQFKTGATRNLDNNKLDYEGFLSPLVIEAFAKYMHTHRLQADGTMRGSSNWKMGIPLDVYMKSGWRHFFDWWKLHSGVEALSPEDGHKIDKVEALCALMFNVQGYLHELLKEQSDGD